MRVAYATTALVALEEAPQAVQKAFFKQISFLLQDLRHPSIRAKKYDDAEDRWQGRVNRNWRFYFRIVGNTYIIMDVIPHPK